MADQIISVSGFVFDMICRCVVDRRIFPRDDGSHDDDDDDDPSDID